MTGTNTLQEQLEGFWAQLSTPVADDKVSALALPSPTGNGPLRLGRTRIGRCLLIPFAKDQHKVFKEDHRSAAVQMTRRPLTIDGTDHWFAELTCHRSELDSVFAAFCADVIVRITADAQYQPPDIAAKALHRWRSLFSGSGRRLGPQQLRGLFAELSVLRRLLSKEGGAVLTWTGPLRKPHDFSLGPWAIEVKASGVGETRVRINGIKQLEPPAHGHLALAHLQVDEDDGGMTVPELVASIREQVGPTPLMLRLELAGYQTLDEKHYENLRLKTLQETWYAVDDDFPRIVAATFPGCQVPVGVDDLRYDVDFSLATPTVLDEGRVEQYFTGLRAPDG
jgi:hypothetical protein